MKDIENEEDGKNKRYDKHNNCMYQDMEIQ